MDTEAVDPPAYSPTESESPACTFHPIKSTHNDLILANTTWIRASLRPKWAESTHLLIAKTKSIPETAAASSQTRSFASQKPNVTINDTPAASSSPKAALDDSPSNQNGVRAAGGYVAVVTHGVPRFQTILMKTEPQNSVEEALEQMLDLTAARVAELLSQGFPDQGFS